VNVVSASRQDIIVKWGKGLLVIGLVPNTLGHGAHSTGGITLSGIYVLVARVAECQAGKLDFSQAPKTSLFRITLNNSQSPLVWEEFLVHYISAGGFTFLVVANNCVDQYVEGDGIE